jgi:hypothetical protein
MDDQVIVDLLMRGVDLIPPQQAQWIAAFLLIVIAIRTGLAGAERFFYELDIRLDGESNWKWVAYFGDAARGMDKVFAWMPVKAIFERFLKPRGSK